MVGLMTSNAVHSGTVYQGMVIAFHVIEILCLVMTHFTDFLVVDHGIDKDHWQTCWLSEDR